LPRTKRSASAREHNDANVIVCVGVLECIGEQFVLLASKSIFAFGSIHCDDGNAIIDFDLDTHAR
jgi:hypothetical protein